jgi:integrase
MWVDGKRVPAVRDGKPVYIRTKKWYVEYADAQGVTRRVPGYTDKTATEQLEAELVRQVERERVGIVDVSFDHLNAPISQHMEDWFADLTRAGRSTSYIRNVQSRLGKMQGDLGWTCLTAIQPDGVSRWLAIRIREGMGQATANHYLDAVNAFCNWCVGQRRLERNVLNCVAKVPVLEPKKVRRALSADELRALLDAAPNRRLVYLTAAYTGLRRNELKQLQWGDVSLDEMKIRLRAATTKAKRADSIDIPQHLVKELQQARPNTAQPMDKVFSGVPKLKTFYRDLRLAGINPKGADGRCVDFHALRVSFGTMLAMNGVPVRAAMALMRHTDIRLTTRVYTDESQLDLQGAVAGLPDLTESTKPAGAVAGDGAEEPAETGAAESAISSGISELATWPGISCHPETEEAPSSGASKSLPRHHLALSVIDFHEGKTTGSTGIEPATTGSTILPC